MTEIYEGLKNSLNINSQESSHASWNNSMNIIIKAEKYNWKNDE